MEFFELAERKMSWIDRRQEVLAADIANADTPGWRTRDLKPFASVLRGLELAPTQTEAGHLAGTLVDAGTSASPAGERAPDGNNVSVDSILTKVADLDASHELVNDLYKKYLGLFRIALGK